MRPYKHLQYSQHVLLPQIRNTKPYWYPLNGNLPLFGRVEPCGASMRVCRVSESPSTATCCELHRDTLARLASLCLELIIYGTTCCRHRPGGQPHRPCPRGLGGWRRLHHASGVVALAPQRERKRRLGAPHSGTSAHPIQERWNVSLPSKRLILIKPKHRASDLRAICTETWQCAGLAKSQCIGSSAEPSCGLGFIV